MNDGTQPAWAHALEERLLAAAEAVRANMTPMRADLTSMRAEMTSTRADLTSMRADIMARIDRLQEDLTRQRENNVV